MQEKLSLTVLFFLLCAIFQSQNVLCEHQLITPEDVLEITVYEHDDLSITTRVSSDGYISFPLLGSLRVAGMTVRELEEKIARLLDRDYIVDPQVTVFTQMYRVSFDFVYVMGEVNHPQSIDLSEKKVTTLLEAISTAGGFTDEANKEKITIIRTNTDGTQKTIKIKLSDITKKIERGNMMDRDLSIQPGDVILVSQRIF